MDKQPTILVVDDDPDILDGILAILESQPYRLQTARDGKRCLEMVEVERPDLLILDLLMPRMDGFAVIRFLRENPEHDRLPIMVIAVGVAILAMMFASARMGE